MKEITLNKQPKDHDLSCGDLMTMAERELAAFFSAVTELFGSEQAKISADDWLHELMATNHLPASTRQWRRFTQNVAVRLANRVNAPSITTSSRLTASGKLAYAG